MRDLLAIAGGMTVLGGVVGAVAGRPDLAFGLAFMGWLPLLFIGLLVFGLKADRLFGVEHGYGWEPVLRDD